MSSTLLHQFQSKPKSVDERMATGKALRKKMLLDKQGNYESVAKRTDPVSILEKQGKTRLPDLVPIRYARMLTSALI